MAFDLVYGTRYEFTHVEQASSLLKSVVGNHLKGLAAILPVDTLAWQAVILACRVKL